MFFIAAARTTPTNLSLLAACSAAGVEADLLSPKDLLRYARPGDVVLARLDVLPSLDGVEPGLWELRRLERRGIEVLNRGNALLAMHDKLETAIRLNSASVPHPRTWHVGGADGLAGVEPPVVVKPRFGSWGRDVLRCETAEALARCLARLRRRRWFREQGALVQDFVPSRGRDLRVLVARGEVIGAVERVAPPGEWRTNVALGAVRRPAAPPPPAAAIAVAAARAVGGDLVGIDLLPAHTGGYVVLEVNGAVDFTPEYSLDGEGVFDAAVHALLRLEAPVCLAGALYGTLSSALLGRAPSAADVSRHRRSADTSRPEPVAAVLDAQRYRIAWPLMEPCLDGED
jgi:RimK family alpha-L-glutamate ligase